MFQVHGEVLRALLSQSSVLPFAMVPGPTPSAWATVSALAVLLCAGVLLLQLAVRADVNQAVGR